MKGKIAWTPKFYATARHRVKSSFDLLFQVNSGRWGGVMMILM